jgi:hypothetical protein
MDFEAHLEPIRPEFENKMKRNGEKRVNPVTEVCIQTFHFKSYNYLIR